MVPIEVTVTRAKGSTQTAPADEDRLQIILNEANQYRATFDGILFHMEGQYGLVIKDTGRIVRAKLSEMTVKTIPAATV